MIQINRKNKFKRWSDNAISKIACLLLASAILISTSCSSYKVAPNGYILHDDNNFVSIDERMSVSIGADLLSDTVWENSVLPLQASPLSASQARILKKLGYLKSNYTVVFRSAQAMPYQLIGLVNMFPTSTHNEGSFVDLGKLSRAESNGARWYQETTSVSRKGVYHAVIPVSEKLFDEKYLSIIYVGGLSPERVQLIEAMVRQNAETYRVAGRTYIPMKSIEDCIDGDEARFYDYTIPQEVKDRNAYTLIKAYREQDKSVLAYYFLLQPGQSIGSFMLCKGSYILEYTTLQGEVLRTEGVIMGDK